MSNYLFEPIKFTDPHAKKKYEQAKKKIGVAITDIDSEQPREEIEKSLLAIKETANQERLKALEPKEGFLVAACIYLVLAENNETVNGCPPEKLYHYAANAFRDYGLLQKAAICYFYAALKCEEKYQYNKKVLNYKDNKEEALIFGKRSAGRAKMLYKQLGNDEHSDLSHVIQQRLQILQLKANKRYLLSTLYLLWDLISAFGTSVKKWVLSTIIVIAVFAILYPILIYTGQIIVSNVGFVKIQLSGFALISSSLLFSIGNLFQFGMLTILTPITYWGQFAVILHGIIAFFLLGTGATFLTRR